MQFHRSEVDLLTKWLLKPNRKPLVIRGARQVGKSTIVRQLAMRSERNCFELNFEQHPEHASFFDSNDPKKILELLSLYFKAPLDPSSSILFLDEIQTAPHVLATLRYFYEMIPELPVIATGSLLDFILAEPEFSMPVGRIEYFYLGPVSFENFLQAMGENALLEWLQKVSIEETIPIPIHQQCSQWVKYYWLIGGMPEVVAYYAHHREFQELDNIKQSILQTYQDDFYKYGRIKQIPLLRRTFQTLPSLVGQTIKYVQFDRESKSIQVREALDFLQLARISTYIFHTAANGIPLRAQTNTKVFKLLFLDIGLQATSLGLSHLEIIHKPDWAWINRGSLAEQFIGQTLLSIQPHYQAPELFYWLRAHQNSAELDYIYQHESFIIPIEVKAGKTGQLKSLHYFMTEKKSNIGVRFNMDVPSVVNPSFSSHILSLPFYLAEQLKRFLSTI